MDNFRRVCLLAVAVFLVLCFRFNDLAAEKGQTLPESQTKAYFQETRQELTVHTIRGRQKGPTLLIVAGIHGDEAGGYLTAERYADVKLSKGNLIIVPRLPAAPIPMPKSSIWRSN
jgi:predicted deacylase